MTRRLKPSEWSPRTRAAKLAWLIRSMATIRTDEESLWCAVLSQAVKDACTQNHEPEFWRDGRAAGIADTCGLDVARIRIWADRVGLEL